MDPLSICASAVALIGASKAITKGLYTFTRYATHAEAHVSSLCSEITTLTGFLSSINKTLRSCRRNGRALALVDGELWRQSDLALKDCEATLMELSTFVARLKTSNKTPIWRAKVAIDMSIHANKLEQFRARLKRSNHSLQTVLQTITVSVALQNNASQESILLELGKLKATIEEAVWVAKRPPVGTHHCQPSLRAAVSETVATKNLKGLVKAAESFYSSATSTVESSLGGGSIADWPAPARETANSVAELSPFKIQRVHEYIQNINYPCGATITEARDFYPIEFSENLTADESCELMENHPPSRLPVIPAPDVDFDLGLVEVLEDFAIEKMKIRHFESAAAFLNKALGGEMGPVPDEETRMRLHIRLGICYILQRNIAEACKVMSKLESSGGLENIEVLHLMHALAMVFFAQFDFTQATPLCTRVAHAKMRLLGKSHPDTLTSLGFLWHLYVQFDWPAHCEAARRKLPPDYVYSHPESEFDYLALHAKLMPATAASGSEQVELPCTSLSDDSESASSQTAASNRCAPGNQCLRRALTRYESQQADTMKVFVSMTVIHPDDEEGEEHLAPDMIVSRNGQKRLISRSMTTMRRHFSTWPSSKPATEPEEQVVAENLSIRRCKTVLHKAPPPPPGQIESAGPTGLVRAKRFLGILKTEKPMITAPTEEILSPEEIVSTEESAPTHEFFPPVELDSKCITREDLTKQRAGTRGQQETLADQATLASMPIVPPSKLRRRSLRPLDMSLNIIPELPELDSGDGCDVGNPTAIVVEASDGSSDGSVSRGSSMSDNRSTVSGSSYSTNTTVSEAASATSDCRAGDTSTVPQRHEMVQLARHGSISLFDCPKTCTPPPGKDALLPFLGSFSGTWQLASSAAAHRGTNSTYKPYRRDWPPDIVPTATDTKYGLINDEYPAQSSGPATQVLPHVSRGGGWRDGSGEAHGLQRTFSWSHGDENLSILKFPNRKPQNAQVEVL